MLLTTTKNWVKARDNKLSNSLYFIAREMSFPVIPLVHNTLYRTHCGAFQLLKSALRIFYYTPLFQSRLECTAPNLYLYGGMPFISGSLKISIDAKCRISGKTTLSGRLAEHPPQLIVGKNCDIGWQSTIAAGRKVTLGDNVRIAGECFLAGYPGHPLNAEDRAKGLPETEEQVGDITLENDVWLATGVKVMAGVTIGEGSIVAAGSIVTKDLPANVLAGGNPARVIRSL